MSGYVIRFVDMTGSVAVQVGDGPNDGDYLVDYDEEAHDGWGEAEWSPEVTKALVFPSFEAAGNTWRAVPANRPMRPDGKPNRPLTAVSIEIVVDPLGRETSVDV